MTEVVLIIFFFLFFMKYSFIFWIILSGLIFFSLIYIFYKLVTVDWLRPLAIVLGLILTKILIVPLLF